MVDARSTKGFSVDDRYCSMRAFLMLLLVAVLGTACAADSGGQEAATEVARDVGNPEPNTQSDVSAPEGDTDFVDTLDRPGQPERDAVLAFENEDSEEAGEDEPAEPDVTSEETPEPAENTPLSRLVDELIVFVEQERGHEFSTRPDVVLLEGDEFREAWNQLIRNDVVEHQEFYTDFTDIYRAMGVIDGNLTLDEIWMRFGDAGVVGYYESERQAIVLRSGEITTYTKTVLVHELVHALDDQVFGIERDEYDDRTDEISWTFSSLVEGSAGVIEERYRSTLTDAERDEEVAVRQALPRSVSLSEFNRSFLELQFGRYRYGDAFAAALWDRGQSVIDDAFVTPPTTSELVIDSSAFIAGESPPAIVDAPAADGAVFYEGVWGEAGWAAVLADTFGTADALALVDGWGGDRYVAWRAGNETCVRLHVEADSPTQLDSYASGLEDWSREALGREIFYPTAELVRVTACG